MLSHSRLVASFHHFRGVLQVKWYFNSKAPWLGTKNSPPLQTPLKSVTMQAQTAESNEFNKSKPLASASMCSNITGSLFSFFNNSGTIFETAAFAIRS